MIIQQLAEPSHNIDVALHRNGIILERARRKGQSLSNVERMIVSSARDLATAKGLSRHAINIAEMEGERNRDIVLQPIRVEVHFAYYTEPFEDIPAEASYLITKSNHPALPYRGNVGADQLRAGGIKIPKTPTYQQWVKDGRKCFRGER